MNHLVKSALDRKLEAGSPITEADVGQARAYAMAYGTDQARVLYAKVKRASERQQAE